MSKLVLFLVAASMSFLLGKLDAADQCNKKGSFYAAGTYKCEKVNGVTK